MAIASAIPGLEVTVEVDNIPLPEYQYEDENGGGGGDDDMGARPEALSNSAVRYIEVLSGAQFSIRWMLKEPFDPATPVEALINIDGSYVNCQMRETGDKGGDRGYKCVSCIHTEGGQDYVQNFRFSELQIDDESHQMSKDLERQLEGIGTITVYFSYVLGEVEVHAPEIPQLSLSQLDTLSEKISQKAAPTPGDVLTHQASLSAPHTMWSSKYHEVQTEKEPFASYTFHYRSTRALKSLGIIPRTPSPSRSPTVEAEERVKALDLNSMTTDQLIAELSQRRERETNSVRIKREHAEAFGQDDDESEIEWAGTRPVKTKVFGGVIE